MNKRYKITFNKLKKILKPDATDLADLYRELMGDINLMSRAMWVYVETILSSKNDKWINNEFNVIKHHIKWREKNLAWRKRAERISRR